ncbi:hypothetical protein KAR91_26490 [Candidatus Pacearchaeota archaeon]|nr:hypothetical protein [Candidatus Pacearchaeota archaeon]
MSLIDKKTYSVERPGITTHTNGVASQAASTTFPIKGNAQPLNGRELLQLPEGDRKRHNLKLYTKTELLPSDLVTIDSGKAFEVQNDENWTRQDRLSHYKLRIMRLDKTR